jgi:hypothetical protein
MVPTTRVFGFLFAFDCFVLAHTTSKKTKQRKKALPLLSPKKKKREKDRQAVKKELPL